jgi:hypothetical protein
VGIGKWLVNLELGMKKVKEKEGRELRFRLKKNENLFSDSKLNLNLNLKPDSVQFTARTKEKEG